MKKLLVLSLVACFFIACNDSNKSEEPKKTEAQLIAEASGYHNWDNVNEIKFTFNVDRPDRHFDRTWTWEPKTGNVKMESLNDTVVFNHKAVDSASYGADTAFINDKYWLLAPFNLMWDSTATITTSEREMAPMSQDSLRMLTITYPSEGGYTPGDAYDIYYDDAYDIKEWVFRHKNGEEPNMITSWEDAKDINGIKIYTTHNGMSGGVKIHFTNVTIK
ncbi:MAG: hypothetical protein ABJM06_00945 [Gilvibacter sp.]